MPLNYNDQRQIKEFIIDPIAQAVREEFRNSFNAHDERLKRVEDGQARENLAIIEIKDTAQSNYDKLDKRLEGMEKFKGKIVRYAAIATGILSLIWGSILAALRSKFDHLIQKFMGR